MALIFRVGHISGDWTRAAGFYLATDTNFKRTSAQAPKHRNSLIYTLPIQSLEILGARSVQIDHIVLLITFFPQ